MSVRDRLRRRVLPRLVVWASTVSAHRRLAAALRRTFGGRATVRLFVAFDDPSSAVALLALRDRLSGRRVRLLVEPVVRRGIPDDPAAEAKREYALVDARRLARRAGLEVTRTGALRPEDAAFLAEWVGDVRHTEARESFCAAAMRELWFSGDGPIDRHVFAHLWRECFGFDPEAERMGDSLDAERRMRRRRLYDTPVAVVGGQWHFAHERVDQVESRLDELGWAAA